MPESTFMEAFAERYVAPADIPLGSGCLAACGPECLHARELAGYNDYVWCSRRGAPRSTSGRVAECAWFTPRDGSVRMPAATGVGRPFFVGRDRRIPPQP